MYTYAWVVVDLFAVLVLLCTVYHCASRGFVRTAMGFFGYMAAALVAATFSAKMAVLAYDYLVRDSLRLFFTRQLENMLQEGGGSALSLLDAVPKAFQRVMQQTGRELLDVAFEGDISSMAHIIVDTALREPVLSILKGICFFLIYSLTLILVRRLSYLFGQVNRLPVIGTANTVLGGIIGVFEGVILLYIIGVALQLVIFATGGELPFLNKKILDATYVYRVFFSF